MIIHPMKYHLVLVLGRSFLFRVYHVTLFIVCCSCFSQGFGYVSSAKGYALVRHKNIYHVDILLSTVDVRN